jgi:hypothetical protein
MRSSSAKKLVRGEEREEIQSISPSRAQSRERPNSNNAVLLSPSQSSKKNLFSASSPSSSSARRGLARLDTASGTPQSSRVARNGIASPSFKQITSPMSSRKHLDRKAYSSLASPTSQSFFAKVYNNANNDSFSPTAMGDYVFADYDNDMLTNIDMNDTNEFDHPVQLPDFILERISSTFQERRPMEDFRMMTAAGGTIAQRTDYGLNLSRLITWSADQTRSVLSGEEAMQKKALAKVHGFFRAVKSALRIQAWYRMMKLRIAFKCHREKRLSVKRQFFRGWKIFTTAQRMHYASLLSCLYRY